MTAKEYLQQYRNADREINAKLDQIHRLWELATKTTTVLTPDKVQSGTENKTERIVAKIVDLEREVDTDIDGLREIQNNVYKFIHELKNIKWQYVLCLRYIWWLEWDEISGKCKCSRRKVIAIHNSAVDILDFYLNY